MAQVELGVAFYTERFGQAPRGMWPSEGSVAEEMIGMVATSGIQWMASDEGVLAQSLNIDSFTRDGNEVVIEADRLYRPYNCLLYTSPSPRDGLLSRMPSSA